MELSEGLHVLLQDEDSKLFNIEAQVMRVCEGGRSAYLQGRNKGGKLITILRNRRFMLVDPKHKVEVEAGPEEWAMVTRENQIAADCCFPGQAEGSPG